MSHSLTALPTPDSSWRPRDHALPLLSSPGPASTIQLTKHTSQIYLKHIVIFLVISMSKFQQHFVDFKFIMLTALHQEYCCMAIFCSLDNEKSFGIPFSYLHQGDFILRHTDSPLKRQNLNKNCVSMCHYHQLQLIVLPVAQKHLQEIEHQACNVPLLWTPGGNAMPSICQVHRIKCLLIRMRDTDLSLQKGAQLFLQLPLMKPHPSFRLMQ